jgi:hypothetical protein
MPYKDKEKRKEKNKEYQKKYYSQNKDYYIQKAKENKLKGKQEFDNYKKNLKCEICGENHPATLDFHHKDPNEKELIVSKAVWTRSWSGIKKEIDKCSVLCSNCHRKLHYEERMAGGGQGVL